jgi:hypothetical protein
MVGTSVLAVSAIAFGVAVAGALIASPGAPSDPESASGEPTRGAPPAIAGGAADPASAQRVEDAPSPVSEEVLGLAVEKAPFDPQRQVSGPYLLPEERVQPRPVEIARPEPPPAPAFRVLGTVADAAGGIAVIEAPGEPPRVLTMGEEILGYRLTSIEGGRVVLWDGQGRNVSVAVPEVAPRTAAVEARTPRGEQNQNRSGQASGGGRGRGNAAAADVVNEAMRRMREEFGGDVRMEMRGDRVILTAPDGTRREISIGEGGATVDVSGPRTPGPAARRRPPGEGGGGR